MREEEEEEEESKGRGGKKEQGGKKRRNKKERCQVALGIIKISNTRETDQLPATLRRHIINLTPKRKENPTEFGNIHPRNI